MKLLFDEKLPARLAEDVADLDPGSAHVLTLGLGGASDREIWDRAADEEFHRLSVLLGPPPKVVWLRLGNCVTADVRHLLRFRALQILAFAERTEEALLEPG